jgi:hypothetical protein
LLDSVLGVYGQPPLLKKVVGVFVRFHAPTSIQPLGKIWWSCCHGSPAVIRAVEAALESVRLRKAEPGNLQGALTGRDGCEGLSDLFYSELELQDI